MPQMPTRRIEAKGQAMIATIIIVGLALYWLGIETDWLRVCLEAYETIDQYDKRILDAMLNETPKEVDELKAWLTQYPEPKLKYNFGNMDAEVINARDRWMVAEDDRKARRNGEMVYQHHNAKGYNQLTRRQKELVGL